VVSDALATKQEKKRKAKQKFMRRARDLRVPSVIVASHTIFHVYASKRAE
jgi:hypothetical protein